MPNNWSQDIDENDKEEDTDLNMLKKMSTVVGSINFKDN